MCPVCISTVTWFAGTTLLPALAVFVNVPRSDRPLKRCNPAPAHPSTAQQTLRRKGN
jgi:hypothetical protein